MEILLVFAFLGLIMFFFILFIKKDRDKPQEQPLVEYPVTNWIDKRGLQGEQEVQRILSQLPKTEYIVLNDVLLPAGKGTTQIDHIIVSLYGIFVIESKNYRGKIYGSYDAEKWSQYINGEQFNFRNPVKQNLCHVIAIEQLTKINSQLIIPLVVFTGSAALKLYGCDEVIYDGMLLETIYRYRNKVFSPKLMETYAQIIDDRINENAQTKSAHVSGVRERVTKWNEEVNAGQCPRCDGYLVLRKGKYGDFYGCSNYPKCKFTKNT